MAFFCMWMLIFYVPWTYFNDNTVFLLYHNATKNMFKDNRLNLNEKHFRYSKTHTEYKIEIVSMQLFKSASLLRNASYKNSSKKNRHFNLSAVVWRVSLWWDVNRHPMSGNVGMPQMFRNRQNTIRKSFSFQYIFLWEIKTFLQKPSLNCTVFFFSSWKILHWSKMGNFPAAKGRALALNIDMFCLHLCETFNCSVDNYPTITRF